MTSTLIFLVLSVIVLASAAFQVVRAARGELPLNLGLGAAGVALAALACFGGAVYLGVPTFPLGLVLLVVLTYIMQRIFAYRYSVHGRYIAEGYMRARAEGKEQLKAYIRSLRGRSGDGN